MFGVEEGSEVLGPLFDLLDKPGTGRMVLLSGPSGSGKTRACEALIAQARTREMRLGGLLSPATFVGHEKMGIDLLNLVTSERRRLARKVMGAPVGAFHDALPGAHREDRLFVGEWEMDQATLEWGNTCLGSLDSTDLLVIDELGPLEFVHGVGLIGAFELLDKGHYRLAAVTVRPALVSKAKSRWPHAKVMGAETFTASDSFRLAE